MLLNRRVFGYLVATLVKILGRSDSELKNCLNWQPPQLLRKLVRPISPLFKCSLEISLAIDSLIKTESKLIFNQLPHSNVFSPPLPNYGQVFPILILADSEPGHVLSHEAIVPSDDSVVYHLNFGLCVFLLSQEFLHILNITHRLPILSSDGPSFIEVL